MLTIIILLAIALVVAVVMALAYRSEANWALEYSHNNTKWWSEQSNSLIAQLDAAEATRDTLNKSWQQSFNNVIAQRDDAERECETLRRDRDYWQMTVAGRLNEAIASAEYWEEEYHRCWDDAAASRAACDAAIASCEQANAWVIERDRTIEQLEGNLSTAEVIRKGQIEALKIERDGLKESYTELMIDAEDRLDKIEELETKLRTSEDEWFKKGEAKSKADIVALRDQLHRARTGAVVPSVVSGDVFEFDYQNNCWAVKKRAAA